MEYMVVKLDEERIKKEGKYSIEKMWKIIDEAFNHGGDIIKKVQSDGSVEYWGNPKNPNYMCWFGIAYLALKKIKWLAIFAEKWIWYDNDDNEDLPYQDTDCLIRTRKEFGII